MSIKDAWGGSSALRWLLTVLGAALIAAAGGFWAMSAQVNHMSGQLETFMGSAILTHQAHSERFDNHAERLRYLERTRRGLPPGDP